MSMSAFWIPVASWVTTLMPWARAWPRTVWSDSGEFGTTVMAVGCWGIRSWMIWICFSGLVSSPPSWRVSTPVRFAKFASPSAIRSNQAMPLTLTTLTIVMSLGSVEPPEPEDFDASDVVPQAASARHAATVETPEMTAFIGTPSTSVDPDGPFAETYEERAVSRTPRRANVTQPVAESRKIDHHRALWPCRVQTNASLCGCHA